MPELAERGQEREGAANPEARTEEVREAEPFRGELERLTQHLREQLRAELATGIRERFESRRSGDPGLARERLSHDYLRTKLAAGHLADRFVSDVLLVQDRLTFEARRAIDPKTIREAWQLHVRSAAPFLSPEVVEDLQAVGEEAVRETEVLRRLVAELPRDELYQQLVDDPQATLDWRRLKVTAYGNILAVHPPNRATFATLYERLGGDASHAQQVAGFACTRTLEFEGLQLPVRIVIFSDLPGGVYLSTQRHEVTHHLFDQLYEEQGEAKGPFERYWELVEGDFREEFFAQVESGLEHFDSIVRGRYRSNYETVMKRHLSSLWKHPEFYDFPSRYREAFLELARRRLPDLSEESLNQYLGAAAERYQGFVQRQVTTFIEASAQLAPEHRRDFVHLLRGEPIRKWGRVWRQLGRLGALDGHLAQRITEETLPKLEERSGWLEARRQVKLLELTHQQLVARQERVQAACSPDALSGRNKAHWNDRTRGLTWRLDLLAKGIQEAQEAIDGAEVAVLVSGATDTAAAASPQDRALRFLKQQLETATTYAKTSRLPDQLERNGWLTEIRRSLDELEQLVEQVKPRPWI